MNGTVKWFNDKMGYGFITSEAGEDIFVHYPDINGLKLLEEGEEVSFTLYIDNFSGKQRAINVTRIEKAGKEKTMNENYIMLNGERIDLTDEQIKKLGLKTKTENYFEIINKKYYYINTSGTISWGENKEIGADLYKVANYCTDESLMQQRALHETLSRLLWRFSMQNDGDKIDFSEEEIRYYILYDHLNNKFIPSLNNVCRSSEANYFSTEKVAQRAIDEIVLPFMKEHPDFVW